MAVGGAVGVDDPAGLAGEVAEDFINVSARGERVAAMLTEAVEDVGGDGPPLPLSHLGFLLITHASHLLSTTTTTTTSSSSSTTSHRCSCCSIFHDSLSQNGSQKWWKKRSGWRVTRLTKKGDGCWRVGGG